MRSATLRRFFGCYLLKSHHPNARGRSYIGFTVNPHRRVRQHNGELSNGAWRTKKWRPWEMVLVLYGFPTQTLALQFEWAWQHPERSLDARSAVARLSAKQKAGVAGKIAVLMEVLNAQPWCYYPLTLQFLSSEWAAQRGALRVPPPHMEVTVAPLDALPEAVEEDGEEPEPEPWGSDSESDEGGVGMEESGVAPSTSQQLTGQADEEDSAAAGADVPGACSKNRPGGSRRSASTTCALCGKAANRTWVQCGCGCRTHIECLARHFLQADPATASSTSSGAMPSRGACPGCGQQLTWMQALSSTQNAGWEKHKKGRRRVVGRGAAEPEAGQGGDLQQKQPRPMGSPSESAAQQTVVGKQRGPRSKKAVMPAPLAAGARPAGPAVAAPKRPRGRPRKAQLPDSPYTAAQRPGPGAGSHLVQGVQLPPGSSASPAASPSALTGMYEAAAPWDDFGGSDDNSTGGDPLRWYVAADAAERSPGGSGHGGQAAQHREQGREQHADRQRSPSVIELLSDAEETELAVAPAELVAGAGAAWDGRPAAGAGSSGQDVKPGGMLNALQQRAVRGQPQPTPQQHQQIEALDLASPSPLPLLDRLRLQHVHDSPRNTPSPAPLRKHRRGADLAPAEPEVVVLSDSD